MAGSAASKKSCFLFLISMSCMIVLITNGSLPDVSILSRIRLEYRNIRNFAGIRMQKFRILNFTGIENKSTPNLQSELNTRRYQNRPELDKSGIPHGTSKSSVITSMTNTVENHNSSGILGKIERSKEATKTPTATLSLKRVIQKEDTANDTRKIFSRNWQPCGTGSDVFVYSAYYRPEEHDVKVVGIALKEANRTVICTFPRESGIQGVTASVEFLPDHQQLKSSGVLIRCSLGQNKTFKPDILGIKINNSITYLKVLHPQPRKFNFTVCVACLHGPYKEYSKVIEMIETDLIFGADHFVIYKHSTTPLVDKVLDHYVKQGSLDVLPWGSPPANVHYYAQMAQIQDCILAHRGLSKYLVIKDLDELIVPHKHKNWHELMNFLDSGNGKNATFIFRNTFFELNFKNTIQPKPGSPRVKSLMYVWRDKRFYRNKVRSKVIMRPELVDIGGIHFNWKEKKGYTSHGVDTEVAYLHHYRTFDGYKWKVKDTRMLDFTDVLTQINKTYAQLGLKL